MLSQISGDILFEKDFEPQTEDFAKHTDDFLCMI